MQLRKLALSGVVAAASVAYVLTQGGRLPVALSAAVATMAPASQVRLGPDQIVEVKDGEFQGIKADAWFGYVRVKVAFDAGRIVSVHVEEYPDHSPTSVRINEGALPKLEQEVITAQSANVDYISGATLTSKAWVKSVRAAIRAASDT